MRGRARYQRCSRFKPANRISMSLSGSRGLIRVAHNPYCDLQAAMALARVRETEVYQALAGDAVSRRIRRAHFGPSARRAVRAPFVQGWCRAAARNAGAAARYGRGGDVGADLPPRLPACAGRMQSGCASLVPRLPIWLPAERCPTGDPAAAAATDRRCSLHADRAGRAGARPRALDLSAGRDQVVYRARRRSSARMIATPRDARQRSKSPRCAPSCMPHGLQAR